MTCGAFDEFDEFSAIDELDAAAVPPHSPGAPGSHTGWSTALPGAGAGKIGRLPIFDAVESDWFRHGRPPTGAHTGSDPPMLDVRDEAASEVSWRTSPGRRGLAGGRGCEGPGRRRDHAGGAAETDPARQSRAGNRWGRPPSCPDAGSFGGSGQGAVRQLPARRTRRSRGGLQPAAWPTCWRPAQRGRPRWRGRG